VSNSARSAEYGWWIALWNSKTSNSSYVFLVVLLWGVLSRCKTTFLIWAAKYGRFFHNACIRSGRIV